MRIGCPEDGCGRGWEYEGWLMIDQYESFSALIKDVFDFLINNQTIAVSLIGLLILYFGFYSIRYQPIKTEKLHLYISGFQFLSTYFILQIIFIYLFLKYLTAYNLIYGITLLFLVTLLFYIFSIFRFSIITLISKLFATIIFFLYIPSIVSNYISQIENTNLIIFLLISYHATMVIRSNGAKEFINQNSYNYKDFYSKKMNLLSYPIFLYPLRITQSFLYNVLFGKDKKETLEKSEMASAEEKHASSIVQDMEEGVSKILKYMYSPEQLKFAAMQIQTSIAETETWFNSFLILISLYVVLTYTKISLLVGLILFIQLFFALTSIAIEHSIYSNGFLLAKVFPKNGEPFICRLMELDGKLIKVLLRGESENKKFNPVEYYPLNEISKIRYISLGEMLNEF